MSGPVRLHDADLATVFPEASHAFISSCSAESDLFGREIEAADGGLGRATFSGIFVPGLNRRVWNAGGQSRVVTFFQTPELKSTAMCAQFLPLCYQDILTWYRSNPADVVMLMVAPPNEKGFCSLGVDCGLGGDLWRSAAVRIAHINPKMPHTKGDAGIPFSALTAYYEGEQDLRSLPPRADDKIAGLIARHAAPFVEDGACLQTGIGKVPDAILDQLHDRRDLRLHTGLAGDGALRLVNSHAMASGLSAVAGSAIGSESLYAEIGDANVEFRPASVTHDVSRLSAIQRLVTINSAMSVDLFGQVYAEASERGFMSGPGGASDFARGARASEGGLRMIVLPSTAGTTSRIVSPGSGFGPVSLSRFDVDVVVTEHGAADLRCKDYGARARALIDIAAPEHREKLDLAWAFAAKNI